MFPSGSDGASDDIRSAPALFRPDIRPATAAEEEFSNGLVDEELVPAALFCSSESNPKDLAIEKSSMNAHRRRHLRDTAGKQTGISAL